MGRVNCAMPHETVIRPSLVVGDDQNNIRFRIVRGPTNRAENGNNEEGVEVMRHGMRISPRDNRLAVWGALLARGLLSFGRVDEAIEAADHACRSDDKIFLPRLVLALAQSAAENPDAARNALNEAYRIRPQLSIGDLDNFASTDEIASLACAGLLQSIEQYNFTHIRKGHGLPAGYLTTPRLFVE